MLCSVKSCCKKAMEKNVIQYYVGITSPTQSSLTPMSRPRLPASSSLLECCTTL